MGVLKDILANQIYHHGNKPLPIIVAWGGGKQGGEGRGDAQQPITLQRDDYMYVWQEVSPNLCTAHMPSNHHDAINDVIL